MLCWMFVRKWLEMDKKHLQQADFELLTSLNAADVLL